VGGLKAIPATASTPIASNASTSAREWMPPATMSCLAVVARSVAATSSVSAGNASLEELAAIFVTRHDQLPFRNNIVMNQLYPTSQMLATCISFGAAPNKAIVGANAFAHAAGIHQHGVIANPLTYEIMTPQSVGVPHDSLVLGKHSGRRALEHRLIELGHNLTHAELDAVYSRFTELADRKKTIYDQDLIRLLKPEPKVSVPA